MSKFSSLPLVLSLVVTGVPLAAQQTDATARLGVFARLTGEWDGEAWTIRGPEGRQTVRQQEWVSTAAGGTIVTVKGLGTLTLPDGTKQRVHEAFAVIHRNHEGTGIMMRAFTAEGFWLDPQIQLTPNGYNWQMTDPRIGMIKYEMKIDEQGRWVEDGYMSRDEGKTWMHFLGMVLVRK